MATKIHSTMAVSDGLDVRVTLADGRALTFHFNGVPADVQAAVDDAAATYPVAPVEPVADTVEDSPIETAFKAQRDAAKVAAIGFIYTNPACTSDHVIAAIAALAPMLNGPYMLGLYMQTSVANGYIETATFDAFKAFILSRTPEQLMEM